VSLLVLLRSAAAAAAAAADYGENWVAHTKNHSAWLMGAISRAIKEAAGY
jgi:hypothetical protein